MPKFKSFPFPSVVTTGNLCSRHPFRLRHGKRRPTNNVNKFDGLPIRTISCLGQMLLEVTQVLESAFGAAGIKSAKERSVQVILKEFTVGQIINVS